MPRVDYAFPFRMDPTSHQAAHTGYATHVDQMIRQVLLTSPGERADLPGFGCGLRQLLFAPQSEALATTARMQVQRSLDQWLSGQIVLRSVDVDFGALTGDLDEGTVLVRIEYTLVETQTQRELAVQVK